MRYGVAVFLLVIAWAATGCAPAVDIQALRSEANTFPIRAAIAGVPFIAQREHHCGPAALAMVMAARGRAVTSDELAPRMLLPARDGALPVDLISASRREGMLAYEIAPALTALLSEVAARNPVIVLQNRALDLMPIWHFSVVTGYDLDREIITVTSGLAPDEEISFAAFDRTWERGGRWGITVMEPGEIPATAEPAAFLRAAHGLELAGNTAAAVESYEAALGRWPSEGAAALALSNAHYTSGQRDAARRTLESAVTRGVRHALVLNNLAHMLSEAGEFERARKLIEAALPECGEFREQCERTAEALGKR